MICRKKIFHWQVLCLLGYLLFLIASAWKGNRTVIYSTDISMHGDLDDFFDLSVISSIQDIDLKVIIDGFDLQEQKSGLTSVRRFDKILERTNEYMLGSLQKFSGQANGFCHSTILQWLESSGGGCDIITVGSLRDIAKAYCSDRELFLKKVNKIYVFAGDAQGTYVENNVALDEEAFLTIMNSGLDIYWIPCFENGLWTTGMNTSYFTVRHSEIFQKEDGALLRWFVYYFLRGPGDYHKYEMSKDDREMFMADIRNIWCAPIFTILDGSIGQYLKKLSAQKGEQVPMPFEFIEKQVEFGSGGRVTYQKGNLIHCFHITQRDAYEELCKFILKEIEGSLIS